MNAEYFACPICKGNLKFDKDNFICAGCGKRWNFYKAIPDFSVQKGYWGELSQDKMEELINLCEKIGWRNALDIFFAKDRDYYEYILDEARANFHFLLSLSKESVVLDAGAGWGTIAFALARFYRKVFAFDIVPQRVRFLDMRRKTSGIENLIPAIGQINYLPFPDDFFDMVVLNGVLEWIPSIDKNTPPFISQMNALKEIRRVLRKGGKLYIGIENRWAFINFLGFKDTHSGLRFAPVLPRKIANVYSKFAKGKPFIEYTYTIFEHRKMLGKAGFREIEFYSPLPTYRKFQWIVPLKGIREIKFFVEKLIEPRTGLQKFVVNFVKLFSLYGFARYFVPDYSIIAKK